MSKNKTIRELKNMRITNEHWYSKRDDDILRCAVECLEGTAYQKPECKVDILEGLDEYLKNEILILENETYTIKSAMRLIFESMWDPFKAVNYRNEKLLKEVNKKLDSGEFTVQEAYEYIMGITEDK